MFGIQLGNAFDGRPLTMTQAIERWLAMGWWATLLILLPFLAIAIASYAVFAVWWVVLVISIIASPTSRASTIASPGPHWSGRLVRAIDGRSVVCGCSPS